MKCVYCGQDEEEKKFEVLDSIADVLRDILEELKKFNKPVEIDDIPDRIKALQMLYDDNKEGK